MYFTSNRFITMKRILMSIILSMAFFGVLKAQDGGRTWLKRYNIDPMNANPVFTRPTHENAEARKEGAGICMNDGLAYNRTYYNFGSDWHYEPKLNLCKEEEDAFSRVTGEFINNDDGFFISTCGQILKYGVIPTDFGAIVAYRVWDHSSSDPVRHYFATFDHKGNLIDAFYAGYREWMNDILKMEPHGNYSPRNNFGGGTMDFSKDGRTLTKIDYYYYDASGNKSEKWQDSTVFNISEDGFFSVASREDTGKPEIYALAEELYILETMPLSDKDAFSKWNSFIKKSKGISQISERVNEDILRLFISRPQEFMAWTFKNKKESVLIGALKPAFEILSRECGGGAVQMFLASALEGCKDNNVKKYWQSLKTVKSVLSGDF